MSTATSPASAAHIEQLANAAELAVSEATPGQDTTGRPTVKYTLSLAAQPNKTQLLELSEGFHAEDPAFAATLRTYFTEAAMRLRNPRPDCYLSLLGLPLSFRSFQWPFHPSQSGADTQLVHGEIKLETGEETPLHAKIAASMTQTFNEVVAAREQPFAESFIYNAVRKTMDQGQLELVKSGNRQPVPVTTRYYSAKRQLFIFNDTTEAQRSEYLTAKVYWMSGVLGGGEPVWINDPRDAQYLNTSVEDLKSAAAKLESGGLLTLSSNGEFAHPCPELMSRHAQYAIEVEDALTFIKPHFNEDMRSGNTNM